MFNAHYEEIEFTLPPRSLGVRWQLLVDTTEDIGYPIEAAIVEAKGTITVPARSTMLLKQIEGPEWDENEETEVVTAEDRKADLGQVGDKVTAASSATAEAVAEQEGEKAGDGADAAADDVVEDAAHEPDFEVEDEHGAIPSGDDSGDSDDDSPHEDTGRADLSAEELRAKRQAAIADEYTDVE